MIRRTILGVVVWGALLGPGPVSAQQETVYRVPVTGVIELGLAPFIARAIREAEEAGGRAVVLEL